MPVKSVSIEAMPFKDDRGMGYYVISTKVDVVVDLSDLIDFNDASTVWTYTNENYETIQITPDNVKNIHIVGYPQCADGTPVTP